ncbi:MAG: DUF1499 domain-containing protein [Erythrobacter sp.]|nr:DUF1499 domain-containing protein [Erythrobacter sp.]
MEKISAPWHARFALTLALLLPLYFAVAALGTKFGLWSWQVGLGSLVIGAGPMLLGIVAALAVVSLILIMRKSPRKGWALPLIALVIPVGIFGFLGTVGTTADANPIHDVATDTANPPTFSEATMSARAEIEANPVSDYATPLGEIEWWADKTDDEMKAKSHAELVGELYPDLATIAYRQGDEAAVLEDVAGAMQDIGLRDVRTDPAEGRVEGVAETFWFGFKDDVVVRVADGAIDIRSVSRVGVSDLGANSARVQKLVLAIKSRGND